MDSFSAFFAACAGVYAQSFLHFWSAIPVGLALGLPPLVIIVLITAAFATGTAVTLFFGDRLRTWLQNRFNIGHLDEDSRLYQIWDQYGVIGFGLTATLTVGAQGGAIIGLALGAEARRLFMWMTLGALLWAILLTGAFSLGLLGVQAVAG